MVAIRCDKLKKGCMGKRFGKTEEGFCGGGISGSVPRQSQIKHAGHEDADDPGDIDPTKGAGECAGIKTV
ncbi:hypothetical protein GRO01_10370 [Gluconobacter roseus NBRC 3990]|uniref:Uncharacterized protein n=1 Tax=Gluconobacter roseus NBRC 3990 TaxID=1307950 RepID=A0A4Y3M855_9PROT|nr:hypothetical protein GRO01_10370 [Gluconobacter roseus NBRC 3990]